MTAGPDAFPCAVAARRAHLRRSIGAVDVGVANDPDEQRSEATVDGEVVGFAEYTNVPG